MDSCPLYAQILVTLNAISMIFLKLAIWCSRVRAIRCKPGTMASSFGDDAEGRSKVLPYTLLSNASL